MKKHIYIYITFLFVGITNINAQDYFSFYNLGDYVVQTQNLSPVYIPKNSFTIAIPVANVGINFNSGFKINDLLVKNESTNKLEYNLVNLYETADETNDLNIDLSINLFYMAFKRKKGSLTIFANTRATNNWKYTKDFLGVTANGIVENFTLNEQNEFTGYNEIGVGFTQTFLNDRLAVAVRAKYLNGFVHSSTEDGAQLSLEIDDNTGYYTIIAENATVNASGIQQLETAQELINDQGPMAALFGDSNNPDSFKLFTENTGFGFDFGATFKATKKLTLEIAVNDIGSINWKENVQNFRIEDTGVAGVLYTGIDLRTPTGLGDEILDQLGDVTKATETSDSFKTKLKMKTYLSARYALTEKNTFSLVAFNTHAFDDFKPSYSLGYNRTLRKSTFGVLASMGGIDNEFLFGANFAVNLGPLQLYAATDSLKAIFTKFEETSSLNLRVGLNLVFGYKKETKED